MSGRRSAGADAGRARRRYEFAVLVLIVGALAWFLLGALERTQDAVEEAGVQAEAAALRVELLDALAHREAHGGGQPASSNPVRWAGREPPAYLGELDAPPAARGVWYFDVPRGELVYRFRSPREARFRLARGSDAAAVSATLAGVGLRRVDVADGDVNSRKTLE